MIPLSVSEISALDGFCDEQQGDHEDEQEMGILVHSWITISQIEYHMTTTRMRIMMLIAMARMQMMMLTKMR